MSVFVAQNIPAGTNVGFTVSGSGNVPLDKDPTQADGAQAADNAARPGGGLGEPDNSPDPLYKYRWWLIGAVALVLVAGAGYTMSSSAGKTAPSDVQQLLKDELFA